MGWANAIPNAVATVNLTIANLETHASEEIAVTNGVGYHDKNWGDRSITKTIQAWSWGHARIGEYSVVWFDIIDQAEKNTLAVTSRRMEGCSQLRVMWEASRSGSCPTTTRAPAENGHPLLGNSRPQNLP